MTRGESTHSMVQFADKKEIVEFAIGILTIWIYFFIPSIL